MCQQQNDEGEGYDKSTLRTEGREEHVPKKRDGEERDERDAPVREPVQPWKDGGDERERPEYIFEPTRARAPQGSRCAW